MHFAGESQANRKYLPLPRSGDRRVQAGGQAVPGRAEAETVHALTTCGFGGIKAQKKIFRKPLRRNS